MTLLNGSVQSALRSLTGATSYERRCYRQFYRFNGSRGRQAARAYLATTHGRQNRALPGGRRQARQAQRVGHSVLRQAARWSVWLIPYGAQATLESKRP